MGKWFNIEYFKSDSIKEHVFGKASVGNCALCGEFLGSDEHHKVTQSRGGNKEDIVRVCRKCHNWIHSHELEAAKYGLYIRNYKIKKSKYE